MILRAARKRLALLIAEWRYRGKPATLATVRRQIGGRYRKPSMRRPTTNEITALGLDTMTVIAGDCASQADGDELERKIRAVESAMQGKLRTEPAASGTRYDKELTWPRPAK